MKTFKEYRAERIAARQTKIPLVQTSFGKHSKEKIPLIQTSFGKHSVKKQVSESEDPDTDAESKNKSSFSEPETNYKPFFRSGAEHKRIHESVAPMNMDKTSNHELVAAVDYTEDSYHLNNALFKREKYGKEITEAHSDKIHTITNLLNKHKTTEDTHVFSGVKFSPAQHFEPESEFGDIPKKVKVKLPSFTSTSTSIKEAKPFADGVNHINDLDHGISSPDTFPFFGKSKHILKIHLPKGTSAMSLRECSHLPSEKEILLNRGHILEIHHKPTKLDSGTYLWDAKIHSHDPEDID